MKKLTKKLSIFVTMVLLANIFSVPVFSADKSISTSGALTDAFATGAYTNSTEPYNTYSGTDLGANYSSAGTTFKVWAPSATAVKLNLYKTGSDSESGSGKIGSYSMTKDTSTGVWSITQSGDLKGRYYTYSVTVNSTKETRDPYARACGINGKRSMVVDLSQTNPEGWSSDSHVRAPVKVA